MNKGYDIVCEALSDIQIGGWADKGGILDRTKKKMRGAMKKIRKDGGFGAAGGAMFPRKN